MKKNRIEVIRDVYDHCTIDHYTHDFVSLISQLKSIDESIEYMEELRPEMLGFIDEVEDPSRHYDRLKNRIEMLKNDMDLIYLSLVEITKIFQNTEDYVLALEEAKENKDSKALKALKGV